MKQESIKQKLNLSKSMSTLFVMLLHALFLMLIIPSKLLQTGHLFCHLPSKALTSLDASAATVKQTDYNEGQGCALRCLADFECFYAVSDGNTCYLIHEAISLSDVVGNLGWNIVMRPYKGKNLCYAAKKDDHL